MTEQTAREHGYEPTNKCRFGRIVSMVIGGVEIPCLNGTIEPIDGDDDSLDGADFEFDLVPDLRADHPGIKTNSTAEAAGCARPSVAHQTERLDLVPDRAFNRDGIASKLESQGFGVHQFNTGAVRSSDADDARYDLISPIGLEAVAKTCAEGAKKYSDFNWEKGMPVNDILNHVLRHVFLYLSGDRSEEHLAHGAWGMLAAIHSEKLWPHLNEGKLRGPGCAPPCQSADFVIRNGRVLGEHA